MNWFQFLPPAAVFELTRFHVPLELMGFAQSEYSQRRGSPLLPLPLLPLVVVVVVAVS